MGEEDGQSQIYFFGEGESLTWKWRVDDQMVDTKYVWDFFWGF